MPKQRVEIPDELAARAMFASDRTCCVCRDSSRKTQIHHIDGDPSNNCFSNLAVICNDCHSDAHTNHAFARNLSPDLIRLYNESWREVVQAKLSMGTEQGLFLEYQQQVLLEVSLTPHDWKLAYMALYPGHFRDTNYSSGERGGDVWDMMSEEAKHLYSTDEWRRYIPLFDRSIKAVSNRLERLLMAHGGVIPVNIKLAIMRTCSQLEVERSVYLQLPQIVGLFEDKDLAFAMRFKEAIRALAHLSHEAEGKRKSMVSGS